MKKIGAMAANLYPSEDALHPELIAGVKSMIEAIPAGQSVTPQRRRELRVTSMMLEEPHIDVKAARSHLRRRESAWVKR